MPVEFVVGLSLRLLEPEALYRVTASVQVFREGKMEYDKRIEHFASWAEVAAWLGTLLLEANATTPAATLRTSLPV